MRPLITFTEEDNRPLGYVGIEEALEILFYVLMITFLFAMWAIEISS